MLVVIFNEFLLEGSVVAHFSLICTRIGMASLPRLKYRSLFVHSFCKKKKTRMGKDVVQGIEQRRRT